MTMNSRSPSFVPGSETDVTLSVTVDEPGPFLKPAGPSDERPTALIAHGAGSRGDFVRRAFGPALLDAGIRLVSYDLRGHGDSTALAAPDRLELSSHAADLRALALRTGATLLGGVSLGAHAAVLAALELLADEAADPPRLEGLLLALPAWTGPPDVVAAANAVQAAELREVGVAPVLARILRDHPGWVAEELADAWPRHDAEAFAAGLTGLARSWAPTEEQLARIGVPVGLVALADDPMHPASVAESWARSLPYASVSSVPFPAPAADRSVLGRAALDALGAAAVRRSAGRGDGPSASR